MKISLCTPCMNRLEYLKETIGINLELIKEFNINNDNKFELSLCDYDSKDGLYEYIKDNFSEFIDSGILIYTKVNNKEYFNVSHAKNIAHKYSTGDVLINLDGDNYLRMEILDYYNMIFNSNNIHNIYLCDTNCIGLIGLSRINFRTLGGYNEEMVGYGFEDVDLMNRLEFYLKCDKKLLPSKFNYNQTCVLHQFNSEKIKNYKKEINGVPYITIEQSMEYNRNIMAIYFDRNIMNPNQFNGIKFGEYKK